MKQAKEGGKGNSQRYAAEQIREKGGLELRREQEELVLSLSIPV